MKFYTDHLTPLEHAQMLKQGMLRYLREECFTSDEKEFEKKATATSEAASALAVISILTGVPAGILWHNLAKKTGINRESEEELRNQISLTKAITSGVENRLSRERVYNEEDNTKNKRKYDDMWV